MLSYQTIRDWVNKFGHHFAGKIRQEQPTPRDKWHLDECVFKINGVTYWLRRVVDGNDDTLDILLQSRRNKKQPNASFISYSSAGACHAF
ncbi:DDE-type integrase/transposase/recombinase [Pseudovibrio sp. WM33]|uniref:DDE-type integrase/transposase/recombinase n=1 Tax=Pseudovibrio sp. WM33 TaxID=1735585 RepID=UPI0007AEA06C|nr:DDE-type integrase/transposase/recombinase [Pseudovibrio sp. WM33]